MKHFLLFIMCLISSTAFGIGVERVEPANWWVGMKNHELQLMVHGEGIANANVSIQYPGVYLKESVKTDNPNYLFLYLDISDVAQAGKMDIVFTEGKNKLTVPYELRAREKRKMAQGVSTADAIYLITPDRFANADPSNDELDDVKVNRARSGARHGGDMRGIINHLDYIQNLGFTAVWLNPVLENRQPGGSYHGYSTTDYYKVDPRFGSNEEYRELVDKAHGMGMKVVMDMIFNHCGSGHWWLKDMPAKDWLNYNGEFKPTSHLKWTVMDPHAPQTEKEAFLDGWFSRGMPDLNQKNRHMARYLIQNCIWWIEYAGIDAVRQDTHSYVDYDFMAQWCKDVEAEYPDFNIMGEVWYPRGTNSAWWQRGSKLSDRNSHLKTVMDFELAFASQHVFDEVSDGNDLHEAGLFKIYEILAQDYQFVDLSNVLIFLDNHDTSRFMRKDETDLRRYRQGIAFLLTTRGIPQLYYGTEILMHGTKEQGDGVIRTDFPGGWEGDPVNAFTAQGRTDLQNEAWNYMQKLLQWRKNNDAIIHGKLLHYAPMSEGCYVYARIKDNRTVLVIMNGTDDDQNLDMSRYREVTKGFTQGTDVWTGKTIPVTGILSIPARETFVLDLK